MSDLISAQLLDESKLNSIKKYHRVSDLFTDQIMIEARINLVK